MVNILNKISLKNMQIVILLLQLHHNLSCIIVRTLLNRHFQHSQNFIDGKSLYMVNILNKISLKNMQIVILLLQLHHV